MALESSLLHVLAWVLTYLVHSTLLLALAWVVARRLDRRALRSRERVWKLALVGGFLTATLQVGLGLQPPLGRILLRPESAAVESQAPRLAAAPDSPARAHRLPAPGSVPRHPVPAGLEHRADPQPQRSSSGLPLELGWTLRTGIALVSVVQAPPAATPATPRGPAPGRGAVIPAVWSRAALIGWGLTISACALLFAFGLRRLRRDLAGRIELEQGPLVAELEHLRLRAGVARRVRLFAAPRLVAPLSMGWWRPAICLPPRAIDELESDELKAVLAHEVSHLARSDPPWLFALWLAETVFFFQPLNRVARRELAGIFELAADGWAARATGDRLALASCLARIAGWVVGAPPPHAHRAWTAAMADALEARRPRSRLGERIERLLDADGLDEPPRPRRAEAPLALGLLAALALGVPGASAARPSRAVSPQPLESAPPATPGPAVVVDVPRSQALLARFDLEIGGLQEELDALRAELDAAGLAGRFDAVLGELEARVERLGERRGRMQALLERARAAEAGRAAAQDPAGSPARGRRTTDESQGSPR